MGYSIVSVESRKFAESDRYNDIYYMQLIRDYIPMLCKYSNEKACASFCPAFNVTERDDGIYIKLCDILWKFKVEDEKSIEICKEYLKETTGEQSGKTNS